MMDIIPSLAQVSLVLHKSNIDIAAVKPALDNLMSAFKKADDHSGNTHYQKVIYEKLVSEKSRDKTVVKFSGVQLNIHRSTVKKSTEDISRYRKEFVSNLLSQMKTRFPAESTKVATSFDVFEFRNLSFLSNEMKETYGIEKN